MAMPMMDMGGGDELESEAAPEEPTDDFTAAATEAFPDLAGDAVRIEALKTAIKLCLEKDLEGGYEDEGSEKPGGLALVFGEKPKAKK